MEKPRQDFWGLWNISFGFFGIQVAFGLQNANISRIFQSLGSSVDDLALLWIAGPVTGLIVQPLVGHFSDRNWGRFGRRRPYFMVGALCATLALFGLPNANGLLIAAALLWLLDAALNISMEPFRAFVGDMTREDQRAQGYAIQTMFIGAGAVLGSLAPWILAHLGVSNVAAQGIPPSVRYAFYIGGAAIFMAVLWTVLSTKEYSPEEMKRFSKALAATGPTPLTPSRRGPLWLVAGLALLGLVETLALDKQLYVLGGGLVVYGLAQILNAAALQRGRPIGVLSQILSDLNTMPQQMQRLAVAQFFTWIALFILWIYTTPVVTQYVFGSTDATSVAYNKGADWVGVLFSIYNGVAACAALGLPFLTQRMGAVRTHMLCMLIGAAAFAALFVIRDPQLLVLPMAGIGVAWASILTMPYVILSSVLPAGKLGVYMGIFNFFIVLPQLVIATIMGGVMRSFFPGEPIWTMLIAAFVMIGAAIAMLRVEDTRLAVEA